MATYLLIGFILCFLIWAGGYAVAKSEKNFVEGNTGWLRFWFTLAVLLFLGVYGYAAIYIIPLLQQLI